MTDEEIASAEAYFRKLWLSVTGKTIYLKTESTEFDYTEAFAEGSYYKSIDNLTSLQEKEYLLFLNATNDLEAEKHYKRYREISGELKSLTKV